VFTASGAQDRVDVEITFPTLHTSRSSITIIFYPVNESASLGDWKINLDGLGKVGRKSDL
jgi:hypothetical protein